MSKLVKKELEGEDLLEKTRERVDYIFENYEAVFIANSGGKDSMSCHNVMMDGVERNGPMDHPIMSVFHDNETPYPETVEMFKRECERWGEDMHIWWTVVPYVASLMTHPEEQSWKVPWDERDPESWIREMPTWISEYDNITMMRPDHPYFDDWEIGDRHYDTSYQIIEGYMEEHDLEHDEVIELVGLRAEESMNRYSSIISLEGWIAEEKSDGAPCHIGYPVYDWGTSDLWMIHDQEDWDYNEYYDKMNHLGEAPANVRNGPPWGAYPVRAGKAYQARHLWPERFERWEQRYPGCVLAFDFGYDLFEADFSKPEDETWEEMTAKVLNSFDEDEREDRTDLINKRLERHWNHSDVPLKQSEPCPVCNLSWEQMAGDLIEWLRNYHEEVH